MSKPLHYYGEEKLAIARSYGADTIDEGFRIVYEQKQSIAKAARVFGIRDLTFWRHAKRIGIKLRGQGGANNFFGRKGNQIADTTTDG